MEGLLSTGPTPSSFEYITEHVDGADESIEANHVSAFSDTLF